ncbi:hypothetical protein [Elioraea sp.]|uniref:hypothetical protein n=1 Tax=Elioraea sp. TaxID=2185103 RepID=UPI003F7119F8
MSAGRPRRTRSHVALLTALEGGSVAFALAGFAWLGVVYLRMLVSPAPQEMREGALIVTTLALLEFRNPYALGALAEAANLYGIVYPLAVLPAAWLFGAGLAVHRAVAGLGFALGAWLLHGMLRREGVDRLTAGLAAALVAAGWLYWVGATARPDGIGVALMMAAYAAVAPDPEDPRRFAACLAVSLLGLATKLYFVFPAGVAAAYVFLFRSWWRGLAFGVAVLGGIAVTLALLAILFPGYPVLVLGANLAATGYDLGHLIRQAWDWAVFSLPLLATLGVVAALRLSPPPFWSFAALAALAALLLALGGHTGAHMSYFFHLLSPPLALAVLGAGARWPEPRLAFALALPVAMLASAPWFLLDPDRLTAAEARIAVAGRLIAAAQTPLVTTELAALAALDGKPTPETGHSEYFADAIAVVPPRLLAPLWLPRETIARELADLARAVEDGLAARRFDVVLANRGSILVRREALQRAGYRVVDRIEVEMAWSFQRWTVDVWRPVE